MLLGLDTSGDAGVSRGLCCPFLGDLNMDELELNGSGSSVDRSMHTLSILLIKMSFTCFCLPTAALALTLSVSTASINIRNFFCSLAAFSLA